MNNEFFNRKFNVPNKKVEYSNKLLWSLKYFNFNKKFGLAKYCLEHVTIWIDWKQFKENVLKVFLTDQTTHSHRVVVGKTVSYTT